MKLAFVTVDGGNEMGQVELVDGRLVADSGVQSVVDAHRGTPDEFMLRYAGWSNGYVRAVKV